MVDGIAGSIVNNEYAIEIPAVVAPLLHDQIQRQATMDGKLSGFGTVVDASEPNDGRMIVGGILRSGSDWTLVRAVLVRGIVEPVEVTRVAGKASATISTDPRAKWIAMRSIRKEIMGTGSGRTDTSAVVRVLGLVDRALKSSGTP